MNFIENYRNARRLLNARYKLQAPLGKLGNFQFVAGLRNRTQPRARQPWSDRCRVLIRSLSFAIKAMFVSEPRLFMTVGHGSYGYPLAADEQGLVKRAQWNNRIANLYSALTEPPVNVSLAGPTRRQDRALERVLELAAAWRLEGKPPEVLAQAARVRWTQLAPDDRQDIRETLEALELDLEVPQEFRGVIFPFLAEQAPIGPPVSISVGIDDV